MFDGVPVSIYRHSFHDDSGVKYIEAINLMPNHTYIHTCPKALLMLNFSSESDLIRYDDVEDNTADKMPSTGIN